MDIKGGFTEKIYRIIPRSMRSILLHRARGIKAELRMAISGGEHPLAIYVETNTGCTRTCGYCPREPDRDIVLEEEVWKSIIDGLQDWGYNNILRPHMYNDPLTDVRLVRLLSYARGKLPDVMLEVLTNGDLLTRGKLEELLEVGVDSIVISIHDPCSPQEENKFNEMASDYPELSLIEMREGRRAIPLKNRGGLVDIGETVRLPRCYYTTEMIIRADGNVVLCCQDYLESNILGNVKDSSVQDIWNGAEFRALRGDIRRGYYELPICQVCGHQK